MKPSERISEITSVIVEEIIKKDGIGQRNWHEPQLADYVNAIIQYLDEKDKS